MVRSPCCVKEGLNRGAWTSQEDKILKEYIQVHGEGKWRSLPKKAGLKRCGKSCRLRWLNYLRPDIKRGNITNDEEDLIIRLHKLLGNRWSLIAGRLPGRTDNEIKNYWNTNISKRVEGHSSSSTIRKPSSSTRSEAKKNTNNKYSQVLIGPQITKKEGSYVVRTKASRCTKVFINPEIEQTQQLGNMAMKAPLNHEDAFKKTGEGDEQETTPVTVVGASQSFSREVDSSDFIMDLEMDNKFLSEFLVTPFDFDMGIANSFSTVTEDSSSQESFQNALLLRCQEPQQQDSEILGSMASLLDPALDWLQDE